jgi:hypothetical protein
MSHDWNSFFTNVNHKLASIRLDLGLRATIPDLSRPWLLWVWVYFKQPRPDGLSSDEEFAQLCSLEDELTPALEKTTDGVFVGCITTDGRREFYFYAESPEGLKENVSQCVGVSHGYEFWCDAKADPGWTQYLHVLYPSDEQRELIENRRLLDLMEQRGDRLESARDMRHWSYFRDEVDRELFGRTVQRLGYSVQSQHTVEERNDGLPYGVCISRKQEMTRSAVDAAVIELFRASKSANGTYDGWECELIVDSPSRDKRS